MEAQDPKSTETSTGDDGGPTSREPDSDATSDETLSDVEKEEQVTDTPGDTEGGGANAGTPSPDGAFDDNRGGDGGVGPM
ncbi:MAG TPA: hypothetical protein VGO91_00250 [Pyrinomonadaceae bacterium]|jgi:hypothetical protein|nr:hypothetical protein [Pyrinomonadaceae bacterium]